MSNHQDEDIHASLNWEADWHQDEELTDRQECELKEEIDACGSIPTRLVEEEFPNATPCKVAEGRMDTRLWKQVRQAFF